MREQPVDEPERVGTTIGRYRILERIGEGGMGVVYRAVQDPLERPVALKLVHRVLASEPDVVSRFLREARIAASLTNPNTVTIFDFGRADDGALYLAMEYVPGESLRHRIDRDKCVRPADAAVIAIQVCRSLLEAHKKHIAHRDLKPENILLTTTEDGTLRVKVLDYGLARSVDPSDTSSAAQVTQVGMILGTPEYMSPEQARGHSVDTRSDIYSLGVVLYEMLTGVTPFAGDSQISLMANVIVNPPPPMRDMGVRVAPPPELEQLVLHMLAKEPADRPRDVLGVLRVLKTHVLAERPAAYSQVFQDPGAMDEGESEDAPTSTHTPLSETTLDTDEDDDPAPLAGDDEPPTGDPDAETATMLPFVEGDRTLVSTPAFGDEEDEPASVTAPHAVRILVDDSRTAPATPALLARGVRMADIAESPTIDSSVGDAAALLAAAERAREPGDGPTSARPRSDGAGRHALPGEPVRIPSPRAKSDPDRGFAVRAKSDPARGAVPRAKSDPGRGSAPKPAPRVTEQIPGRGGAAWREQDEAHRQLAERVSADGPTEIAPAARRHEYPEAPGSGPRSGWDDLPSAPPVREQTSRRAATEVIPTQRTIPVAFIVGGIVALLVGVLLALWWTGVLGGPAVSGVVEGLPAGYAPSVPPAAGWTGTYETSRGQLVLEQQGDSVAGTLGDGSEAVRLAGRADGPVVRFAWASPPDGRPVTSDRSGRGELRWYVTPAGDHVLRATLGYGTASVGAGAVWATPRR